MGSPGRKRLLAAAVLACSLLAAALAFVLWWWSDRLTIAFDHRWLPPIFGVTAVVGLWRSGTDADLLRRRSMRWGLGVLTALMACGSILFTLTWFSWRFLAEELSRTTTSTSIGVEVDQVVAQQGIGPNTCQFLDLRTGAGPFRRHRVATRCMEADGAVWKVDVDGRVITLSNEFKIGDRVERWACSYEIDPASLRLRTVSSNPSCDNYLA